MWDNIFEWVPSILNVWVGNPEHKWLRQAWEGLTDQGLTTYSTDLERHIVLIRLLTLAVMYEDFCYMAWRERYDRLFYDDFENLEMSAFRLGQLVEGDFDEEFCSHEIEDDIELFENALKSLINARRDEVCRTLRKYFGGDSMVFAHMWITKIGDYDQNNSDVIISDILMDIDSIEEKAEAFMWISDGMPSVLW